MISAVVLCPSQREREEEARAVCINKPVEKLMSRTRLAPELGRPASPLEDFASARRLSSLRINPETFAERCERKFR